MSLVNDMLNDLEARRGREPVKPVDLDWISGQGSVAKKSSSRIWLIIVVAVVMIALVIGSWLYLRHKANSAVAPVAAMPAAGQAVVTEREAATLNSMAWTTESGVTVLKLQLSASKPYSLNRDAQLLRLRIYDVKSRSDIDATAPRLPVESLVMQTQGDDLVATLNIKGDFSFSDRLSSTEANTIEVILKPLQAAPKATVAGSPLSETAPARQPASVQPQQTSKPLTAVNSTPKPSVTRQPTKPAQLTLSQRDLRLEKQARELLQSGESYRAQELLQPFVESNSGALRSARLLISLWLSQQRFESANELIATTLGQYPEDIELRILRGKSLLAEGRDSAAVDWLMQQSPDVNAWPQYYELLGLAARRNQQYELSEQVYRGLVGTDPNRGDWLVGLGIALDAQARAGEARAAYQQAVASRNISGALKQYAQQRLAAN